MGRTQARPLRVRWVFYSSHLLSVRTCVHGVWMLENKLLVPGIKLRSLCLVANDLTI